MQPSDQIDSDSWRALDSLEFAVRFGRLLTTTRRRSKNSVEELAASSRVGFDASQLRQFERGSTAIDEQIVEALCLLYAADVGQVLPMRRPVTIADRRLFGSGASVGFEPEDPTSLLTAYLRLIRRMRNQRTAPAVALRRDDILVLADYLEVDGSDVVARLSTLLNASPAQRATMAMLFATGAIVIGLTAGGHAMAESASTSTDASSASAERDVVVAEVEPGPTHDRDLFIGSDAAAVAASVAPPISPPVSAAPATAHVRAPASPPASAPAAAPVTPPESPPVGPPGTTPVSAPIAVVTTALAEPTPTQHVDQRPPNLSLTESAEAVEAAPVPAIDQVADVVGLSPATRLQAAPASTLASDGPTPNQSGCNPDPSEAVMSVVIPDIAYTCPVYAGGQSTIDAGFVTLVTDAGASPVLATRPGEPGTLWLAGHRSTHGAAFSKVPDLADGALITVSSDDATATYRIVGRSYFEVRGDRVIDASGEATAEATWASVIRDDLSGNLAPRLVLQTCEGENSRWMIYADLVN